VKDKQRHWHKAGAFFIARIHGLNAVRMIYAYE